MFNNAWGEIFGGEYGVTFWIVFLLILLISLLVQVLFLLNLRRLLMQVSPPNRAMGPDLVWLNLIPFFSYAWMIYTVIKIRDSVEAEFRSRGMPTTKDPAYGVGMGYAVLSIIGAVMGWATPGGILAGVAAVGGLMGLASLVLWILYWVRTARVKNELQYLGTSSGYGGFGHTAAPAPKPPEPGPAVQPTEARCSSCGLLSMPGDEFCRSCGLRVGPPERGSVEAAEPTGDSGDAAGGTCSSCGADLRPNARFCSSCGRPVA